MRLVPERSERPEILDRPDNSPADLKGALRDIRLTNRWLGGRKTLLGALDPYLASGPDPLEILDVGAGGGDLPLEMVRHAQRKGRRLRVTAIDREPQVAALAHHAVQHCPQVSVVRADALRLPFAERSFDLVTASLFLHHFSFDDLVLLLNRFRRLARHAVVVNDLRRHRVPWLFIYVASRLTLRHPMYAHDAPLSVLRGFTTSELHQAARRAGAREPSVRRRWPYRLVLTVPAAGEDG
jgi:ubiquinone/menaquinone biosynthesis C-methylase UbiE